MNNIDKAQKVSELLNEKIKLETDLSNILSKDYKFNLSYEHEGFSMYGSNRKLNINSDLDFIDNIKAMVIVKLRQKIKEIEIEINKIF